MKSNNRLPRFVWWGTVVLLIAAVLRLILLHDVPPGLSQDEVLNADIVTFIRQGRHALFFREGFGHEPLYHYWSAPFQVLLGDNVLSIRLPAVFLGLLLVAATMRWARRDFGRVPALVAGLGLAVSWWPIVFSRVGIRPIMEPLLLVAAAWFWQKRPWLAGLLLGLAFYTYTGARVVFLLPVGFALLQWLLPGAKNGRGWSLRSAIIILAVCGLLYLPLGLTLRADPTLQQRIDQLEGPLAALRQGDVGPVWQATVDTLGVFSFTGDPRWTYTLPGRPLFDPVTSVLFYGGLALALWRVRQPQYTLLLVWLGVGLLPSAITPQSPSIIRMIGALPVVYLFPGLAVSFVVRKSLFVSRFPGHALRLTPYALLVTLLLFNAYRTTRDGFIQWPSALETRLDHYQTVLLSMARYWREHPVERLALADSFFEPIDADSFRRNLGRETGARWVQGGVTAAGAVVFPQGEGNGRLYVPEFAALPPDLLDVAGVPAAPLYRSSTTPSFAVYELPAAPDLPETADPVTLDGKITLTGYEILPAKGERPLLLFTVWRVEAPLPWNLTAFVHLLSPNGDIVAQHDGLDAAPLRLQPGDTFVQVHPIVMPSSAVGPFTLQLGLYTPHNNRRLTHPGEPGDRILIGGESFFDETNKDR